MPLRVRYWGLQWMRLGCALVGILTLGLPKALDSMTLAAESWFLDGEANRRRSAR